MNTPLFWIGLLGMIGIYNLYQSYRVDRYRQQMFEIRDRLFDQARAGVIPFTHPAYRLIRSTINGYIRFAHRIRLASVLHAVRSYDEEELRSAGLRPFREEYDTARAGLGQDAQRVLDEAVQALERETVLQVVLSSWLVTLAFLPVVAVLFIVRTGISALLDFLVLHLKSWMPALDSEAMAESDCRGAELPAT